MPSASSLQPRLDSIRAARFVEIYRLCRNAGQNHDDIAAACGLTPPNLQNIIESGGVTTQNVLSRLENWARLTHIELPPRIAAPPTFFQSRRDRPTTNMNESNGAASNEVHDIQVDATSGPGPSLQRTRPVDPRSKVSEQQRTEFQAICEDLKSKYKLKVQERLRATGYRSLTGLTFAIRNGPSVLVYERARFIRNALLAGTYTKEKAFEEAERRWPMPANGRHGPRKRRKNATRPDAAIEAAQNEAGPAAESHPDLTRSSDVEFAALAGGVREKLIRGFTIIEQAGLQLSRISDSLRELANDPGMPKTVRKTAAEMLNGLTVHTLPVLECEPPEAPPAD